MRILHHDALEPRSVQTLELIWLDHIPNALYLGGGKRNEIRKTIHKADPAAISRHRDNIARQQRAPASGSLLPVQDGTPGEMPSQAYQDHAIGQLVCIARPEEDAPARTHDPLAVCLVQVDGNIKTIGPFHHCRIVVWV